MKQAFHEAQALWEKGMPLFFSLEPSRHPGIFSGPKTWPKDEPFFLPIFTSRSDEHMKQIFNDYRKVGRIDIEKDIEKELSADKDARELLLAYGKPLRLQRRGMTQLEAGAASDSACPHFNSFNLHQL